MRYCINGNWYVDRTWRLQGLDYRSPRQSCATTADSSCIRVALTRFDIHCLANTTFRKRVNIIPNAGFRCVYKMSSHPWNFILPHLSRIFHFRDYFGISSILIIVNVTNESLPHLSMSANVTMVMHMLLSPQQVTISCDQRRGHPHYRPQSVAAQRAGHPHYRKSTDLPVHPRFTSLAPPHLSAGHPHYRPAGLPAVHPRCRSVTRDSAEPLRHRSGGRRFGHPRSVSANPDRVSAGHPGYHTEGEDVRVELETESRRHGRKDGRHRDSSQELPEGVTTVTSQLDRHARQVQSAAGVHPRLRRNCSVQLLPVKVALVAYEEQVAHRGGRPCRGKGRFATNPSSARETDDVDEVRHAHAHPHPARRTGPHAHHAHVSSSHPSRGRGGRPSSE